ncbi:MAG: ferritin-like domain-containing protein [Planctomycetaceae bacterium]
MPDARHNAALNDLLVRLYRSLLQYAVECWPWTDETQADEHRAVEELAARQRVQVGRLAELLDERQWAIDFGNYPDWSELHYVSLDYLLQKLIDEQKAVVEQVKAAQAAVAGDAEGVAFVVEILVGEERHLAKLKELAANNRRPALV